MEHCKRWTEKKRTYNFRQALKLVIVRKFVFLCVVCITPWLDFFLHSNRIIIPKVFTQHANKRKCIISGIVGVSCFFLLSHHVCCINWKSSDRDFYGCYLFFSHDMISGVSKICQWHWRLMSKTFFFYSFAYGKWYIFFKNRNKLYLNCLENIGIRLRASDYKSFHRTVIGNQQWLQVKCHILLSMPFEWQRNCRFGNHTQTVLVRWLIFDDRIYVFWLIQSILLKLRNVIGWIIQRLHFKHWIIGIAFYWHEFYRLVQFIAIYRGN